MRTRLGWLALVSLVGLRLVPAQNAPAPPRLALVELFTSEGCSSCPPADALLRKLHGMKVPSGQMVVGVSEHVTYWNNLGWADPFSQGAFTARQNGYGERFRLDSVYTPQAVVNGASELNGADREGIERAIARSSGGNTAAAVKIDEVRRSGEAGDSLAVTYTVSGLPASGAEVYAIIADDAAQSSVLRGENSGRTLQHVSVARSLTRIGTAREGKAETVPLTVPGPVAGQRPGGRHLIVFAQERGQGKILAVGWKAL